MGDKKFKKKHVNNEGTPMVQVGPSSFVYDKKPPENVCKACGEPLPSPAGTIWIEGDDADGIAEKLASNFKAEVKTSNAPVNHQAADRRMVEEMDRIAENDRLIEAGTKIAKLAAAFREVVQSTNYPPIRCMAYRRSSRSDDYEFAGDPKGCDCPTCYAMSII